MRGSRLGTAYACWVPIDEPVDGSMAAASSVTQRHDVTLAVAEPDRFSFCVSTVAAGVASPRDATDRRLGRVAHAASV